MNKDCLNPYRAGAPVTETRMFFGREDLFERVRNSTAGQVAGLILVLHGQRRVGKPSLLKQPGKRVPEHFAVALFNLQWRAQPTLDRFGWRRARKTARALRQEHACDPSAKNLARICALVPRAWPPSANAVWSTRPRPFSVCSRDRTGVGCCERSPLHQRRRGLPSPPPTGGRRTAGKPKVRPVASCQIARRNTGPSRPWLPRNSLSSSPHRCHATHQHPDLTS